MFEYQAVITWIVAMLVSVIRGKCLLPEYMIYV